MLKYIKEFRIRKHFILIYRIFTIEKMSKMLKKICHTFIVILLVITTSGITISRHYCGNSLFSTALGHHAKSCCDSKCQGCHDEIIHFKVVDHFNITLRKADFDLKPITLDIIHCDLVIFNFKANRFSCPVAFASSPPIADHSPALLQIFRC